MAIERNAGGISGNYVKDPGEYRVRVHETKTGLSKSQKPMLTVVFHTWEDKAIAAYFVKTLTFHMKALESLKVACGLKVNETADNLVGKECGILVEAQDPTPEGRVFMSITGYGPANAVGVNQPASPMVGEPSDDNVPF